MLFHILAVLLTEIIPEGRDKEKVRKSKSPRVARGIRKFVGIHTLEHPDSNLIVVPDIDVAFA
jgi:hypothetical protein